MQARELLTCCTSLGPPLWAHLLDMTRQGHRRREGQHSLTCSLPLSPVHLGATWESTLPPARSQSVLPLSLPEAPSSGGGAGKPQLREVRPARLWAGV